MCVCVCVCSGFSGFSGFSLVRLFSQSPCHLVTWLAVASCLLALLGGLVGIVRWGRVLVLDDGGDWNKDQPWR